MSSEKEKISESKSTEDFVLDQIKNWIDVFEKF